VFVPKYPRFVLCRILVSLAAFVYMADACSGPGACLVDFGQGKFEKRKILAMERRWGNDVVGL